MAQGPERGGFTLLLSIGVGLQNDQTLDETNVGLAGLNLGIGGFVSDRLALLFRAAGTNVSIGPVRQTSGFVGPSLQYWTSDRVSLEGGVGLGFWDIEGVNESGLGILLGFGYTIVNNGRHNLHIGMEYAPAFTDPDAVHNLGLVFGWQLL